VWVWLVGRFGCWGWGVFCLSAGFGWGGVGVGWWCVGSEWVGFDLGFGGACGWVCGGLGCVWLVFCGGWVEW